MYTFDQQNDYIDNNGIHTNFYDAITEISRNTDNSTYKANKHLIRAVMLPIQPSGFPSNRTSTSIGTEIFSTAVQAE
jgi:hypothetical protein